jgi:hypothetical protein
MVREVKLCNTCGIQKFVSDFYKRKDGYRYQCIECDTEYRKNRRKTHPETMKNIDAKNYKTHRSVRLDYRYNYNLKTRYGINAKQREVLLKEQDNKCAICKRDQSEFKIRFAVDHNHITGKIRGLLCGACNKGLGHFNDSANLMYKAYVYVLGGI